MVTASNKASNSCKDDKKNRAPSPNGHASDEGEKEGGKKELIVAVFKR